MRISDWSSDVCSSDLLDNGLVRRAARHVGDVDLGEESEILDALARPAQLCRVEGIAFDETELPANDLVERPNIAADVDTLDEDTRPLLNVEGDVDGVLFTIAFDQIGRAHV